MWARWATWSRALKDVSQVKVGDTVTWPTAASTEPLPGYREAKPMVFTGLFPIDGDQYEPLKEALEKLSLNDPALVWEPETSHALGFGFRVGFLGLLHMEVIKERLEREFGLDLLATAPSVEYHVYMQGGVDGVACTRPRRCPTPELHRARGRALSEGEDPHPARLRGRRHGSGRGARRGNFVHHELPLARPPWRCSGRSRCPSSSWTSSTS